MAQTYFATTLPGLEEALQTELRAMRCKHTKLLPGGVEFEATRRGLYQALYTSRCAHRILLRLDDFRAGDLFTLHRKTERIEWSRYLPPHAPVQLHITSHRSRVHSRDAIERTVFSAIQDALKPHPPKHISTEETSSKEPPFGLWVRIEEDRCELSLDATGNLLYQRGWRLETGEAPLRESIACALLLLLGWTPQSTLIDPVCGSGTFLIEAARLCASQPPRFPRPYLAQQWADFDAKLWSETTQAPLSLPAPWRLTSEAPNPPSLWGFDHNVDVLECAQRNAEMAHTPNIHFATQGLEALTPTTQRPGFLIANPPYGKRISRKQGTQKGVEQILLDRFAQHFEQWQLGLLLPRSISPQHPKLQAQEIARFRNGGFPVTFWRISHPVTPKQTSSQ